MGGGACEADGIGFVAYLSRLAVDYASLSRRSTVPTPIRDTSNSWALSTMFIFPHVIHIIHGRSRMPIDPPIPAMLGRSTSGFY